MRATSGKYIKIFYCYAHEDEVLRDELEKHLRPLRRSGLISEWNDRQIEAGTDWEREIETHLNTASIILLLISPDFIYSDYCYGKEMKRALKRHNSGDARIIPVILRPIQWEETPIGKLQALPTDGEPITLWPNRDQAFLNVAKGIHNIVNTLHDQMEQVEKKQAHKDKKENILPAITHQPIVTKATRKDVKNNSDRIQEVRCVVRQAEEAMHEVQLAIKSGALTSSEAESYLQDAERNVKRAHVLLADAEAAELHNMETRIEQLERHMEALQQQLNSLIIEKKSPEGHF